MDKLNTIKTKMMDYLHQFNVTGNLSVQDVDFIGKIVDIVKDIDTICAMEESEKEGYSSKMNSYDTSVTTPRGNTYNSHPTSYRSGRYSSRMYHDDPKTKIINSLEDMMQDVSSESDREVIIRCIEQLGN